MGNIYRTDQQPTIDLIQSFIESNITNHSRLENLKNYYLGKHAILNKVTQDESKPNNKIVNNYASYITNMNVGYFMGSPVSYLSKNEDLKERVQYILNINDEEDTNHELAKNCSIYGVAYELLYMDEEAEVRFALIDPLEVIPVYHNSLEPRLNFVIRSYVAEYTTDDKEIRQVDVYTKDEIISYRVVDSDYTFLGTVPHSFGEVPVIVYENNIEQRGDFENVISLIDAYNHAQSNTMDDMDHFTDAYLVLHNMPGTTAEEVAMLKENRVLLVESDQGAEWLTKQSNDTLTEHFKDRINDDIHKFSQTPNMSDEQFSSNLSGVAINYKLLAMEQNRINKERKFKKALYKRLRLMCNILNIKGQAFNYRELEIMFSSNIPQNLPEIADMVTDLSGILSEETLLSILPFIPNPKAELDKKKQETEDNSSSMPFNFLPSDPQDEALQDDI